MNEQQMWETISKVPGLLAQEECWLLYRLAKIAPLGGWLVELGTFKGRGTAVLALSRRGKVITIDDYSYEVESSPEEVRENLSAVGLEAVIVKGSSAKVPPEVTRVSLLLVDTKHTVNHFRREMRAWLPLMMPHGIVACHDFGSPKYPRLTGAIREAMEGWERLDVSRKLVGFRRRR